MSNAFSMEQHHILTELLSSNMNYFIYTSHYFTPHGKIWSQLIDLAPNVWLHSSVGRASHQYRGGHRFESRWSPDFFQASSFQLQAWKKKGLQRDSNPWPLRCQCNALPTEPWSLTLGARSINWVHNCLPVRSEMMWGIYEITHIWTAVVDESEEWSFPHSFFRHVSEPFWVSFL